MSFYEIFVERINAFRDVDEIKMKIASNASAIEVLKKMGSRWNKKLIEHVCKNPATTDLILDELVNNSDFEDIMYLGLHPNERVLNVITDDLLYNDEDEDDGIYGENGDKYILDCNLAMNPVAKPHIVDCLDMYFDDYLWIEKLCLNSNPDVIELLEQVELDELSTEACEFLSANPAAIEFLKRHRELIKWVYLCKNPTADAVELVAEKMKRVDRDRKSFQEMWRNLSANPCALSFLEQHIDKIHIDMLSANPSLELCDFVSRNRIPIDVRMFSNASMALLGIEHVERFSLGSNAMEYLCANESEEAVDFLLSNREKLKGDDFLIMLAGNANPRLFSNGEKVALLK